MEMVFITCLGELIRTASFVKSITTRPTPELEIVPLSLLNALVVFLLVI